MSLGARIASVLLVLVAAIVQASVAWRIEVAGSSPELVILVVSAIALLGGSVHGAAHGFLAGVAIALFAALPLGPYALVGTIVGYTVGRVGEALVTDDHPVPPLAAGIFATITLQIGRPLVEFLVNPDIPRVDGLWTQAAIVTLLSSVLAVPVYLGVRRVLVSASSFGPLPSGGEASS